MINLTLLTPNILRHALLKSVVLLLAGAFFLTACQPDGRTPSIPPEQTKAPQLTPEPLTTRGSTPLSPTATNTPAYRVPLDQLRGQQLVFDHPWTGVTADTVDRLVDQFNQTNEWGIHIMVRRAGSSMALANRVEKGPYDDNYPAVVVAPSEHLLDWFDNGERIVALNDLINDPNFGMSETQRVDYPLVFWQQDQSGGSQVGIPATRDAVVLYYNQTWASELGFAAVPTTWDEFKTQICAAANANAHDRTSANDGTGGWIINTDGVVVYSWLKAFGLKEELSGQPLQFRFNQPAALTAFTALRELKDLGCTWVARSTSSNEYFANRQALVYAELLSDAALQAKTNQRLKTQDNWTILPFPGGTTPVVVTNGLSYGILRSNELAETAGWLFIRWMSQPENSVKILLSAGGLPVNSAVGELAAIEIQKIPQWAVALNWLPEIQSVPPVSGWRIARFILQDAFWQSLQSSSKPDGLGAILEQIDSTILDVQSRPAP